MSAKSLASVYTHLSAEERFRLIVAAGDRGDEAEQKRLANASKRITFSNLDYSPFARALQELAILAFVELVELAAEVHDAFDGWSDADTGISDGKKDTPATANQDDATDRDPTYGLFLAKDFILRTKAAGWMLFCKRLGISPFGLWQRLPGFERLRRDLKTLEATPDRPSPAFTLKRMVAWMNAVRQLGEVELAEADILSAERIADAHDAEFRKRVAWWGG